MGVVTFLDFIKILKVSGYLHETGTNSDRYELVPVRNSCPRLHETGTKHLVDYMRPVPTQRQQILEQYNIYISII